MYGLKEGAILAYEQLCKQLALYGYVPLRHHASSIYPTILPALNEISNQQAKPTKITMEECRKLMDYLYTHPKAIIHLTASDMILYLVLDAAYLVLPEARI